MYNKRNVLTAFCMFLQKNVILTNSFSKGWPASQSEEHVRQVWIWYTNSCLWSSRPIRRYILDTLWFSAGQSTFRTFGSWRDGHRGNHWAGSGSPSYRNSVKLVMADLMVITWWYLYLYNTQPDDRSTLVLHRHSNFLNQEIPQR
jgi:hypothetical protein